MASNQKVSLVNYRRNSSDMDMSSSEDDQDEMVKCDINITDGDKNGCNEIKTVDRVSFPVPKSDSCKDERLGDFKGSDDRREDQRRDRLSPDRNKREKRKGESDSKEKKHEDSVSKRSHHVSERSSSQERRKRRSRDRSRGRSPNHHHHRHRSRSPGRHKHSPDRRDSRKRSHSPERRSYKSRRASRSPEFYRSKRLERKVARIDRLGLEINADPRALAGSIDGQLKDSGLTDFFNPGASNHQRIAQQIQKRRLLWGNKKEAAVEQPAEQSTSAGSGKAWEAATFKGDNDGKMTEKFKRLMGIKGEPGPSTTVVAGGSNLIQKQEEMFSNMEAQYQVARMATHTHRGIGLGFGTFQVPPR